MSNRKYQSDGHNAAPVPEVIRTGTILRMVSNDGGVSPFSDTVVIGIWSNDKNGNRRSHYDMAQAIESVRKEYGVGDNDYRVNIEVARPYMYASSIGICFNWLTGVEKFSINPHHILRNYKVVEMSTGKPANYNQKSYPLWEVVVGNVGNVYKDDSESGARQTFAEYVDNSKGNGGRVSGENVTLMCDGEIVEEYVGTNTQVDHE